MIKEFHGYSVSDTGDVYGKKGQLMNRRFKHNVYVVRLYIDGSHYEVYVKNLVAELFLDNPNGCDCVIQLDKDKSNCNVDNLKWVSRGDSNNSKSKPCSKYKDGILIESYKSESDASKKNNVKAITVHHWCVGRYKDKRGFTWKYN